MIVGGLNPAGAFTMATGIDVGMASVAASVIGLPPLAMPGTVCDRTIFIASRVCALSKATANASVTPTWAVVILKDPVGVMDVAPVEKSSTEISTLVVPAMAVASKLPVKLPVDGVATAAGHICSV